MIVSHRHRFIFIMTRRTAGTLFEARLSAVCGPEDIVSPPGEPVETPYPRGQNARLPVRHWRGAEIKGLIRGRWPVFHPHVPASLVKAHVGDEIWRDYYTFCIERNPYERALTVGNTRLSNWPIYTEHDAIIVDHVMRYDALNAEIAALYARLGLGPPFEIPEEQVPDGPLAEAAREKVSEVSKKEIAAFGFTPV